MVNWCIGQHSVYSGNYICKISVLLHAHVFAVIAFLALKIQGWSSLYTIQKMKLYLETSITIIKMPGYIAQNLSQLYQGSTNVRLHSFSFIIQFLSLQSGWLSWSRSVSLLSKTFYGLNLARVLPIFFIQDHVCLICSICINYIICIPIIFVLNHHIHTFSIHYTRSFSIIKIFIIGQVLSYTNNCKKMKQSS